MDRRHPGPGGFTDFAHAWFFCRASSTRRRSRSGAGGGTPGRTGPTGGQAGVRGASSRAWAGWQRVAVAGRRLPPGCPRLQWSGLRSSHGSALHFPPLSASHRSPLSAPLGGNGGRSGGRRIPGGEECRSEAKRVGVSKDLFSVPLHEIAMGENDPIEVPLQNALHEGPQSDPIPETRLHIDRGTIVVIDSRKASQETADERSIRMNAFAEVT